jgi:hypothetical protein
MNTTDKNDNIDVDNQIKQLYDSLPEHEKRIFANFDQKVAEILLAAKEQRLDELSTDEPLDFTKKHPEILHPPHITDSPHEITVHVKAEVSEIDENGSLAEIKEIAEQFYHIPIKNKMDYRIYLEKFFEKFHSNLELTCQEIQANQSDTNA